MREQKEYLQEASVGMAVMDLIPVLLFGGTVGLLGTLVQSPLFWLGGSCCILAGFGKALWKLILAVSGKNCLILNRQFRYGMSGGFLLIAASLIGNAGRISWAVVRKQLFWFPGNICFLIGICGMVLMMILAIRGNHASVKANWLEQSVNLIAQLSVFLGVLLIWYGSDSYAADETAADALTDTETVTVREISGGLLFDGPGEETALIFYPGARVDDTAYAPLMQRLAEGGVDCFLLEMPYHMAIFGVNRAADVIQTYDAYESWYLGGHSLGGAMAASYAASAPNGLDGLILLAAYPTKQLPDEGLQVLSLYGSEDGVLNREKLTAGEAYMPETAVTVCLEGGNHAYFGSYGEQDGDGAASISPQEQQDETAKQILEMINGWSCSSMFVQIYA